MSAVRVWSQDIIIPTYPVGKPNKNPMFLEHRVYQGASGRVYPHAVIDTVSDVKQDRRYTALCLENEYLYIMVLPELGGRVQRALDKTNGYDFVYYNEVIKPAMVGLTGPWISGGIEFNWPQHHRPSTFDPVQWSIEENPDGSASVIVGETETMYRTRGVSRMTLYPGKAYLEIQTRVYNRTELMQNFLWWANPAVAVNDHTRSIFPQDVYAVMDHGKRDVSAFPIARGTYYKMDYSAGVDISRYRNVPVPTSYMAAHSEYDFLGNYDDGKQAGLLHVADHHISPGKKQWTWGCGEFGQAWDRNLTDENGPYIELMTGCFTDNQPDFTWLMPQEEKRFTQYFMPYKGVGAVGNATREAVVGVERDAAGAHVRAYATRVVEDARITVTGEEGTLLDARATLSPKGFYEAVVAGEGLLCCTVTDADGRLLVRYQEQAREERPLPSPAEPIPPAAEVESADLLYLYATHLEQYHHATWDAADYLLEGLRRDANDVRLNTAYGCLLMKRGLVAESVAYLRRAVSAATVKNPNPADGSGHYFLGVALELLGEEQGAYDAFRKAAWSGAWQDAGYYRAGCIEMRRGEWEKAEELLREALRHGEGDTMARNALTALLRKQGRAEEALDLARGTLRVDPLDAVAWHERELASGSVEAALPLESSPASEGARCTAPLDAEARRERTPHSGNTNGYLPLEPNPAIEAALEYLRMGCRGEAAGVLRDALKRRVTPMILWHLAYITGDVSYAEQAENAAQDGCFPHRVEDERALRWSVSRMERAPMAHHALGCYWYDKRQYDRAFDHWTEAARLAPNYPTARRNLALAYYNKRHQPKEALAQMEEAFRLDPTDARVLMELDQLLGKLHTPAAERLRRLERHAALVDERDDLRLSYATLLNQLGRYQEALNYIEARRFHPWEGGEGKTPAQWRVALIMLARERMQAGEWEAAIPLLEKAAGAYPHNLGEGRLINTRENDAHYWLGVCHHHLGHEEQARELWRLAAKGDTTPAGMLYYNDQPPESIFYQGLALAALGERERADAVFGKLRAYAAEHMEDVIQTEYFAVSLPEMAIFDEDLSKRNRVHCLLMEALGALGQGETAACERALTSLEALAPEHQGAAIHGWGLLKGRGFLTIVAN